MASLSGQSEVISGFDIELQRVGPQEEDKDKTADDLCRY